MSWSTRQIAELAGTTVKAVRHYHTRGLLAEPERGVNGYKHYGVAHLTRLLRIRRLSELGVSLQQIAAMGAADEHPEEALKVLDAELSATIDRLQRIRAELALMMSSHLATDLPVELAGAVRDDVSEADRALMVVYGRVLDPAGIEAMRQMLVDYRPSPIDAEFDHLPAAAAESVRQDLAARFLPHVMDIITQHPDVLASQRETLGGARHLGLTVNLAMTDLYNPAQLDVLERVGLEMRRQQTPPAS